MKRIYKHLIMLTTALMVGSAIWAMPVDANRALAVAKNFLQAQGGKNAQQLQLVESPTPHEFYLFAAEGGGFVMVAADDAVLPILGYSTTSTATFEGMPTHVASRLELYDEGIRQAKRAPSASAANQWRLLEIGERLKTTQSTPVGPLLTTTWNQSPYYNELCPYDSEYDQRTVTGCVATATAQIMKYWNHPTTGYGSHSYEASNSHISYGTLEANFGNTTYQWASMPNELTAASSTAQLNAVATLMYHVGVADEMTYDVSSNGGSGAQNYSYIGTADYPSSQNSLIRYFKYSPNMSAVNRDMLGNTAFCQALYAELANSRPILISGYSASAGHSFVLDGYDAGGLFHVNWGWGGYCDGYFEMGALNPSGAGIGASTENTYNLRDVALIGIQPNTSWGQGGTITVSTTQAGATVSGGGSYSFGDSIAISAGAPEGYVFSRWNDYSFFTDRSFYATGGNYAFQAYFAPLSGDTLDYCGNRRWATSFSSPAWAIRLPSSVLTAGKPMWGIDFHPNYEGSYSWSVMSGSDEPTATIVSGTVDIDPSETLDWYTIRFDEPATIDATQNLWIVITYNDYEDGQFPAAICYYCGNPDGMIDGENFFSYTTAYGWHYTYMLRGLFGTEPEAAQDECVISSFPYSIDFEQGAPCWDLVDNAGGSRTWTIYNGYGVNGSRCAGVVGENDADDWLYTPYIDQPGTYSISWMARVMDENYPESYRVYAVGNNDSTLIYSNEYFTETTYTTYSATFEVAQGDKVRIKFNYLTLNNAYWAMLIDDVSIAQIAVAPEVAVAVGSINATAGSATFTATPNSTCLTYDWYVTPKAQVDYYIQQNIDNFDYDFLLEYFATHEQLVAASGSLSTASTITATNLEEGTTYGIYVRANGDMQSTFVEAASFALPYVSGGTGVATATITASDITATSVTLNFNFGDQTAFYRITGYYGSQDETAMTDMLNSWGEEYNRGLNQTSISYTEVDENATLYFYLMPYNQNGESGQLATATVQLQDPVVTHTITINNPDYGYIFYGLHGVDSTISRGLIPQGTTTIEYAEGQRFCIDFGDVNPNKQTYVQVSNQMVGTVSVNGVAMPLDEEHFEINDRWNDLGFKLYTFCDNSYTTDVTIDATFLPYDPTEDIEAANLTVINHGGGYLAIMVDNNQLRIEDTTYYTFENEDTVMFTFGTFAPGYDWSNLVADSAVRLERMLVDGAEVDFTSPNTSGIRIYNHTDEGYSFYNYILAMGETAHTVEFFFVPYADETTCTSASMLALTEVSATTATVQWMPSPSAEYYTVSFGNVPLTTTDYSYSFEGLQPSTTYTLTLITHCTNGGEESTTFSFTTEAIPEAVGVELTVDAIADHAVTLTTTMSASTTDYYLCIYPKGKVEGWMNYYGTTLTEELIEDLLYPYLSNVQHFTSNLSAQQFADLHAGTEYGIYLLACSATDTVGSVQYFTTTGTMPAIELANTTATSSSLGFDITGNSVTTGYALFSINYDTLNHYYQTYYNLIQQGQYSLMNIILDYRDTIIQSAAGSGSHTVSGLLPDAPYYIYAQAYSNYDTTNVFLLDSLHTAPYVAPATYTLTVLSANAQMGTVSGSGTYDEGTTVQIEAVANEGYHFTSWNDGNTDNPRSVTVSTDATYIASFEADAVPVPTYTLTVLSANAQMGTVSGSGTYDEGTTVQIEAVANAGYHFTSWNDGNTDNPRSVTVSADATYIASFEADAVPVPTYTLTVLSANAQMGTVSGSGTYDEGTTVQIEAIPADGYRFTTWNDGNTDNPRSVTVSTDATYIANFEVIPTDGIEAADGLAFTLYPNPATTQVTLNYEAVEAEVEVLDMTGRVVLPRQTLYANSHHTLDLSGLAAGTYFVSLRTGNQTAIRKLVIK